MRIAPRRNRQLRADRHGCSATPGVDLGAGHAAITQRSRTRAVGSNAQSRFQRSRHRAVSFRQFCDQRLLWTCW